MAESRRLLVVDADTHIDETEQTWAYVEPHEKDIAPVAGAPRQIDPSRPPTRYWVVDGRRHLRFIRDDKRTGLVSDPIHDLAAVRLRAERARGFGYMGTNLIHPSHIQLAHEVFGPSKTDIEYWKGLAEAVEDGQRKGTSAVVYKGTMMDIAHLNHAREMLRLAGEYDT